MALTKAEKAMLDFNSEVTALALKKIDKNQLATTLAAEIQRTIKRDINNSLFRNLNVGRLITQQLSNENTKTGRNFQGLITEITNDMISAIRTPATKKTEV